MSRNNLKAKINELDSQRTMYNTLRQLTIQRAVSMLDEGERGIYTRLAQTMRRIEKRWSVMIGLLANREGALLEMDWDIRTLPADLLPPGTTEEDAKKQAVALRAAYEQIENLREAIKFLHLASFRGFAHLQKTLGNGDATVGVEGITRLEPLFQWHMIRDGLYGEWRFDHSMSGSFQSAEPFDQKMMIFREAERPIGEVALIAYIYEMLGRKDWAGFIEIFGIPDIFFVMPQNTGKDDLTAWQAQVEAMIGAGKGLLPNGSDIKTAGGDIRGTNPFSEFVKFQREDVVLAGTGGKLTMMAESGSGTLAGGAQADVFKRIAAGEAREISEVFQRSLDIPLLKLKFPNQPVLAWFEIAAEDAEDTKDVVENITKLASQGYITEPDQVQEKTGLRVQYVEKPQGIQFDSQALNRRTVISNRHSLPWYRRLLNRKNETDVQPDDMTEQLLKNIRKAMLVARTEDWEPVLKRLAEIADDAPDGELFSALEKFQTEELPELAEKVMAGTAGAKVLEQSMTAALFNGVSEAVEGRKEGVKKP